MRDRCSAIAITTSHFCRENGMTYSHREEVETGELTKVFEFLRVVNGD